MDKRNIFFGNVFVFKFEARKTCQTIDLQLVNSKTIISVTEKYICVNFVWKLTNSERSRAACVGFLLN